MSEQFFRAHGFSAHYDKEYEQVTLPVLPLKCNSGIKTPLTGIQLEIIRNTYVNITTDISEETSVNFYTIRADTIDELIAVLQYAKTQIQ